MLVAGIVVAVLGATSTPALADPVASVSPSELLFSDASGDNDATVTQPVTLTNTGADTLHVSGSVDASDTHFIVDDSACKNKDVASAASCVVTVSFKATTADPVIGKLNFDTTGGAVSVDLLGNVPRAQVDPTPRAFVAAVGTTSAPQQIALTNTGSADLKLTLLPVVIGSDFAVNSTNCPDTLAAGASCSAQVSFAPPAATGGFAAKLRFTTNDPASPAVDVPLTGTGLPAGTTPPPGNQNPPGLTPTSGDSDGDQVVDSLDLCPTIAGDLKNGCPSELNAEIVGRWRVNALLSQLISLSVNTTIGSRIDLRCSGDHKKCGFSKRTIFKTTRRLTSLTHYFKGKRILSSSTSVTVRVTRPQQTGTYKRLVTRRGRKLPKVTQGCLSARTGAVTRCA
jgi:hypothetical protein